MGYGTPARNLKGYGHPGQMPRRCHADAPPLVCVAVARDSRRPVVFATKPATASQCEGANGRHIDAPTSAITHSEHHYSSTPHCYKGRDSGCCQLTPPIIPSPSFIFRPSNHRSHRSHRRPVVSASVSSLDRYFANQKGRKSLVAALGRQQPPHPNHTHSYMASWHHL